MKIHFYITKSKIYGDFYSNSKELKPLLIFIHGFKGFKDWGGFPYFLDKISASGYNAASFNFTHNGVSDENPQEFTRLDLFAKNTFSRELSELDEVIKYFCEKNDEYNIDVNKIGLIGHSRGGGIAILKTASDNRIKCLITLSSVSTFDRYTAKLKLEWKKKGYLETENTRTKQIMRLNASLLEDFENNREKLDILKAASKIKIPALLIHGREDLSVKYTEAEQILSSTDRVNKELIILENTGHTFGVVHPFNGSTQAFEKVIDISAAFFKKHL